MTGALSGRQRSVLLLLILAAAAALRALGLDRCLTLLEINTWWYGQMPLDFIILRSDYFPHIYALAHLLMPLSGEGEAWVRLPFVLFGLAGLPLLYLLGCRLFDEETGLAASFLAAISVDHIRFSQEARYYPLLMFYSLAGLYCLLMALDSQGRRRAVFWGGFVLAHTLNLHVHIFALYPFALCALILSGRALERAWRKDREGALQILIFGAAAVLAALLGSVATWERIGFFFRSQLPSGQSLLEGTAARVHNPGNIFLQLLVGFSGSPALAGGLIAAGTAGVLLRGRAAVRAYSVMGVWLVLPPASLAFINAHYHFEPWYFIFELPILLLFAASGLGPVASWVGRTHLRRRALLICTGLGGFLWLSHGPLRAYYAGVQDPWRESIALLNRECRPGDAVFFHPAWGRDAATRYYSLKDDCRGYDVSYLLAEGGVAAPEIFRSHGRVWIVSTETPVQAERAQAGAIEALLQRYYMLESRARVAKTELSSYRRNGVPLPLARPPAPGRPGHEGPLGFHLLGNLDEPMGGVTLPLLTSKRISLGARERSAQPAENAGFLYVWSGGAVVRQGTWERRLRQGDLARLEDGSGYTLDASSGGAVLLGFRPRETGPARAGRPALPALLAERTDAEGRAGYVSLWTDESLVAVRRLPAGGRSEEGRGDVWPVRTMGIVLRGQVRFDTPLYGRQADFYFRKGDIFLTAWVWPPKPFLSVGQDELILLLVGLGALR